MMISVTHGQPVLPSAATSERVLVACESEGDDDDHRHHHHRPVLVNCSPALTQALPNALVLTVPKDMDAPFEAFPPHAYSPEELYARKGPTSSTTWDSSVNEHWRRTGGAFVRNHAAVAVMRALHDTTMTMHALRAVQGQRVCAFFGGHDLPRSSPAYKDAAHMGRGLARCGMMIATGGGPGCMEAALLGAFFAARPNADLDEAIAAMAQQADTLRDAKWLSSAMEIKARFPLPPNASPPLTLSIPTWFYGNEPSNVFPSAICKFFDNAQREALLIHVANQGAIFFPGSSGTASEIFNLVCENAYGIGRAAPCAMVFYSTWWERERPALGLVKALSQAAARGRAFEHLLLTGERDPDHICEFLAKHAGPAMAML